MPRIRGNEFLKNILVLVSGTGFAQFVTLASMPILSRLFAPEAFGVLGIFSAITGIFIVMVTLSYEQAIVLPKEENDSAAIFVLIFVAVFFGSIASAPAFYFVSGYFDLGVSPWELTLFVVFTPIVVFTNALNNTLGYWATRQKEFKRIATSQILRSVSGALMQILAGLLAMGAIGLLGGRLLGTCFATSHLGWRILRARRANLVAACHRRQILEAAKRFVDFPRYNLPRALLNALSVHLLTIYIGLFFDPAMAGFYWFTHRLLQAPISLVGTAVKRVFFQRASEIANRGGNVFSLLGKTTAMLTAMSVLPVAVIVAFGPNIFDLVFGDEWRRAGSYAQWLILGWFIRFVNVPSIMLIPIYNLQRHALFVEILKIILIASLLPVAALSGGDLATIATHSCITFLLFGYLMVFVFLKARRPAQHWRYS